MPTYQYKREDGTMFEIMQKISDEALKNCPDTGQKVKRVITGGSGVVYKGSGWYVTDYKNRSGNGASGSNGRTNGSGTSSAGSADSMSGSASTGGDAGSDTNRNSEASGATGSSSSTAAGKKGA